MAPIEMVGVPDDEVPTSSEMLPAAAAPAAAPLAIVTAPPAPVVKPADALRTRFSPAPVAVGTAGAMVKPVPAPVAMVVISTVAPPFKARTPVELFKVAFEPFKAKALEVLPKVIVLTVAPVPKLSAVEAAESTVKAPEPVMPVTATIAPVELTWNALPGPTLKAEAGWSRSVLIPTLPPPGLRSKLL